MLIKQSAFLYQKKKYLKIMGCLEKAEIFPFTYDSPQQSIVGFTDLVIALLTGSTCKYILTHMPSLYFSSSQAVDSSKNQRNLSFLKVLDALRAVFGKC